ncbi:MAG: hypothetical protein PHH08_00180 [Candidatus ainarchaeum sp.]|nr:hypothetical protein [Candidatus ainarchaeum sp.]
MFMAEGIISSFDKFAAKLPKDFDLEKHASRASALKHYFSKGGVVSIALSEKDWPRLLYPTKDSLRQKISECAEKRKKYESSLGDWKKHFVQAQLYHVVNNVKKLKEPLYWKHVAKVVTDSDYRKDAESVRLPAHLVSDKRWKPMVQMFVNDLDYRKQLTETVETSIVYRDKTVAKYADDTREFRMSQSGKQIDDLEKKIAAIDADISALQELIKWASF